MSFFDNEGISSTVLIESPLKSFIEGAPVLWLVLFGLFVASAYLSVKNTSAGYKYGTFTPIVAVTLLTVFVGFVLTLFDFGHAIYYYLMHNTSFWEALVQTSDDISLPF